ncbi:MAG: hypothetical protein H5T63_00850 [Chloroflexi bacterium]|nr:hypothetical protein [Chloroflexota bacterium]
MTWARRDLAYALVIVWAFVGIAVKHVATPLVAWTAGLLAVAVAAIAVVSEVRRRPVV